MVVVVAADRCRYSAHELALHSSNHGGIKHAKPIGHPPHHPYSKRTLRQQLKKLSLLLLIVAASSVYGNIFAVNG